MTGGMTARHRLNEVTEHVEDIGLLAASELIARLDAVWDRVIQNLESGALVVETGSR